VWKKEGKPTEGIGKGNNREQSVFCFKICEALDISALLMYQAVALYRREGLEEKARGKNVSKVTACINYIYFYE
jgi:hypothetical protein